MESLLMEWLSLTVRWIHIITGVAWIGASFYFNWLEGNLERNGKTEELEGDLWAVHGGGFYHVSKYKKAPENFPSRLHWFRWEAYFTWISGMSLLAIVYYWGASVNLIDPSKSALTPTQAILISLSTIVCGWFVYDGLCKTKLLFRPLYLAAVIYFLLTVTAYSLCQVFSSKGAYIHIGVLIGTLMVGNVFRVIIPAQRIQVHAAKNNLGPVDPMIARRALTRSLHNNYFTLPILFIMISNHFPMTYSHQLNWLILAGLSAIGILTRHYFNLKNRGYQKTWILPLAALAMIALALVSSHKSTTNSSQAIVAEEVTFEHVQAIIKARCISCHSVNPTDDVFTFPPNGVAFDTKGEIMRYVPQIKLRVVDSHSMPLANKTQMLESERKVLDLWIQQVSQNH